MGVVWVHEAIRVEFPILNVPGSKLGPIIFILFEIYFFVAPVEYYNEELNDLYCSLNIVRVVK